MSSRQAAAIRLAKIRSQPQARAREVAVGAPVKKRGRRQPQAQDFQVTSDLPPSVPILDKELRAIEILLGRALQELLGNDK
jgi:hypothetical protein